jgi:hypothetical protein
MKFLVHGNISHNGKLYAKGAELQAEESEVKNLIQAGAISRIEAEEQNEMVELDSDEPKMVERKKPGRKPKEA